MRTHTHKYAHMHARAQVTLDVGHTRWLAALGMINPRSCKDRFISPPCPLRSHTFFRTLSLPHVLVRSRSLSAAPRAPSVCVCLCKCVCTRACVCYKCVCARSLVVCNCSRTASRMMSACVSLFAGPRLSLSLHIRADLPLNDKRARAHTHTCLLACRRVSCFLYV